MNAKFVTNLGRAIIEKLSKRMQGQEIQSLSSYGKYWGVRDMYLTKAQRTSMPRPQQGFDYLAESGNLNLLCSGSSTASLTGPNAALAIVFGKNPSQFCTPLYFELLTSQGPFHTSLFGDQIEYEIVFADLSQVIMNTDTSATPNYSLRNITLQFENAISGTSYLWLPVLC